MRWRAFGVPLTVGISWTAEQLSATQKRFYALQLEFLTHLAESNKSKPKENLFLIQVWF